MTVVNVIMDIEILQSCANACRTLRSVPLVDWYANVTLRSVRVTIDAVEKQ